VVHVIYTGVTLVSVFMQYNLSNYETGVLLTDNCSITGEYYKPGEPDL